MARKFFALFVGLAVLALAANVTAEDKKKDEVKSLEGKLVCTKCELKETAKCGHCLLVKEKKDGKEVEVKYYLVDKGGGEPYHGDVCSAPADAKVKGKVVEKKEKDKVKFTIEKPEVEIKK